MLSRALDLAEDDPEAFVVRARETKRVLAKVLAEGGKKIDAAYQKVRTRPKAKRVVRNAAIRAAAREMRRRGL